MAKTTAITKKNGGLFGFPGAYAIARNQAGGDWAAGLLLFRIAYRWTNVNKKLQRLGREWVAMSRSDWAREAGLSESEMKNKALPKLRNLPFVTIRAMRLGTTKLLWVNFDPVLAQDYTEPWDFYEVILDGGIPPGHTPDPAYPYKHKKSEVDDL